eukprot:1532453-Pyramimonas_sp.AAC.2
MQSVAARVAPRGVHDDSDYSCFVGELFSDHETIVSRPLMIAFTNGDERVGTRGGRLPDGGYGWIACQGWRGWLTHD